MANYHYKAIADNGETIEGDKQASSQQAVIDSLQRDGYLPVYATEISVKNQGSASGGSLFSKKVVSSKEVMLLMSELATLLEAGLPLDQSLKRMQKMTKNSHLNSSLMRMLENLHQGDSLATTMAKENKVFDVLQINMVRAGEASGNLQDVIAKLAEFLQRTYELRSTVITALIYPIILLTMSVLSLFMMLLFVVPQFIPMFADAEQQLPLLTAIVFQLAGVLQNTWWIIIIVLVFGVLIIDKLLKTTQNKIYFDAKCLTFPIFGPLLQSVHTARFSRTLGTLLTNDVALIEAVQLARDVLNNKAMTEALSETIIQIEQGKKLAHCLRKTNYFPDLLIELIEVGEESGQLDTMLLKAADIYDKEVHVATKRMLSILEPVLIIGLGVMIGLIIISIMLAMLGLNDLIG